MNIDRVNVCMTQDGARTFATEAPWAVALGRVLTAIGRHPLPQLNVVLQRACDCGATPFEVVAGAPVQQYGARVTIEHVTSPETLAHLFNLDQHPWGIPRWIGLRATLDGEIRAKPYHLAGQLPPALQLPSSWPTDLSPRMASLDGESVEAYLAKEGACRFEEFAGQCLSPFGLSLPRVSPRPRPHRGAFGVSIKQDRGGVRAISLFADWRALPRDDELERAWMDSLESADERMAYRLALAGVKSLGFVPPAQWHSMAAWTLATDGTSGRALSLSVPRLA
jgi:hypothetical protein